MTMMTIELSAPRALLRGLPLPVLVAVSGGLDSMCLLHLTAQVLGEGAVTAAHYNHHLRPAAARDEDFVKKRCAEWGIPLVCGGGDVAAFAAETGKTLEEAGRDLRYAFLERARQERGCAAILTAHHADDNAETLLLNLLRGTGAQGLAGIPAARDGIYRPLLSVTRAELAEYAEKHNLPHVEDETNETDDAARNLLRHRVLPVLRELNPKAVENMNRAAALLAEDQRALEVFAGKLLHEAEIQPGKRAVLPLAACKKQPKAVLSRAVLGLLASVSGHRKDLTARHVEAVMHLLRSKEERQLSLPYGLTARREGEAVVIEKNAPVPAETPIAVGETVSFGAWRITLSETPQAGESYAFSAAGELAVTPWRSADRMTLPGSRGSRSLKRLCADAGLSPQQRDGLPVLRAGERPAAVPGVGTDVNFVPQGSAVLYVTFHKETKEKQYEK